MNLFLVSAIIILFMIVILLYGLYSKQKEEERAEERKAEMLRREEMKKLQDAKKKNTTKSASKPKHEPELESGRWGSTCNACGLSTDRYTHDSLHRLLKKRGWLVISEDEEYCPNCVARHGLDKKKEV